MNLDYLRLFLATVVMFNHTRVALPGRDNPCINKERYVLCFFVISGVHIQKIFRLGKLFSFLSKISLKDSDVITHFFLPEAYVCGILTAKLARHKGPLLMSRRSLNNYREKHPFSAKIERKLHKYYHLILTNSNAVQHQLIEGENVPPEKTVLIYNGVDENRFMLKDKTSHRNMTMVY